MGFFGKGYKPDHATILVTGITMSSETMRPQHGHNPKQRKAWMEDGKRVVSGWEKMVAFAKYVFNRGRCSRDTQNSRAIQPHPKTWPSSHPSNKELRWWVGDMQQRINDKQEGNGEEEKGEYGKRKVDKRKKETVYEGCSLTSPSTSPLSKSQ